MHSVTTEQEDFNIPNMSALHMIHRPCSSTAFYHYYVLTMRGEMHVANENYLTGMYICR